MIDLHSHVLPGMDDGSRSVEESIRMLTESATQGIRYMAATSHFYATKNNPREFLHRRERALQQLQQVWQPGFPRLILGAEVYYFDGISRTEELDLLKLEGTHLLLLEMPFSPWSDRMVSDILELQSRRNTTVLLAHIERYLSEQPTETWDLLLRNGVRMQCNAEFFLHWKTRRKALHMLRQGRVHFIASDCHNMTSRPPQLGDAMEFIQKKTDGTVLRYLNAESAAVRAGWEGS